MVDDRDDENSEEEFLEWITKSTEEELANQMVEYFLEISEGQDYFLCTDPHIFWGERGHNPFALPDKQIRDKIVKVEKIAKEKVDQIRKEKEEKREQEENEKLPQLIVDCVAWMKKNGFGQKLTRKYLGLFLGTKRWGLLEITVERLYVKCNEELKKG